MTNSTYKKMTKGYLVKGPDEITYSIWDHGDELTVCEGPSLMDRTIAKLREPLYRKMDADHRWQHIVDAAGAIHVAKFLGVSPNFHLLWEGR